MPLAHTKIQKLFHSPAIFHLHAEKPQRARIQKMERYPSPLELTAASALLLLSDELLVLSPAKSPPKKCALVEEKIVDVEIKSKKVEDEEGKLVTSDSTSCPSSIITKDGPSDAVQSQHLWVMAAAAACCQEMKLKVVRRTRSKVHYITGSGRASPKAPKTVMTILSASATKMTSRSTTTPSQGSCLSSGGSSEISTGRSFRYDTKRSAAMAAAATTAGSEELKKRGVRSTHIRRRAEAILKMLSGGCSSEVRIRQLLGDSPDTSKALRMLVKMDEVKRIGVGGRSDPYIYMIAEESSTIL
ncbi:hypothetical protein Dimus_002000 [Dionaea muscipula]